MYFAARGPVGGKIGSTTGCRDHRFVYVGPKVGNNGKTNYQAGERQNPCEKYSPVVSVINSVTRSREEFYRSPTMVANAW